MLKLYVMQTCPYCKKVRNYLDENKIEHKIVDIAEPVHEEELLRLGGKLQVPFLVDTERDVMMYESDDIIKYLDTL